MRPVRSLIPRLAAGLAALALSLGAAPARPVAEGGPTACRSGRPWDTALSLIIEARVATFRAAQGREGLRRSAALDAAARLYAQYLCRTHTFEHVTALGYDVADRVALHGRTVFVRSAGENLARFWYEDGGAFEGIERGRYEIGARMQKGWEESPSHRRNLLDEGFDTIGIGVSYRRDRIVGVQVFADVVAELTRPLPAIVDCAAPLRVRLRVFEDFPADTPLCVHYRPVDARGVAGARVGCGRVGGANEAAVSFALPERGSWRLTVLLGDHFSVGPLVAVSCRAPAAGR